MHKMFCMNYMMVLLGGHFGGDTIAHKVLSRVLLVDNCSNDAHAYARKCEVCQKSDGREIKHAFPLQLVSVDSPFHN
jgi:hypothetical protein